MPLPESTSVDGLISTDEAAAMLKVKRATLEAWRSRGQHGLPFVKWGRAIRYRRSDVEAWIATHTFAHTSEYSAQAKPTGGAL